MHTKRSFVLLILAALLFCGCASPLIWRDNVVRVGEDYLSREAFEAWYEQVKTFDEIMPEKLCDMLGIDGALRDESALLAFARYETVVRNYGQADAETAAGLLKKLGIAQDADSLACAIVYCSIDAARSAATKDVQVTDDDVYVWYQQQVQEQSTLAESNLAAAQENYVCGAYTVTVYVPEGLKYVQVIGVSFEDREPSEAFSTAQSAWRSLLYGESFTDLFGEYNDVSAYGANGVPRTFCLYEGWDADADIARCAENLDEPGQMCGPTLCRDACLIVRYDSRPASGAIDFKLIEDQCAEGAQMAHRDQLWRDTLSAMQDAAQVRFAPYH